VAIVEQVGFIILELGREPEGVGLGHEAGGAEDFTEGPIFVSGFLHDFGGIGQEDK